MPEDQKQPTTKDAAPGETAKQNAPDPAPEDQKQPTTKDAAGKKDIPGNPPSGIPIGAKPPKNEDKPAPSPILDTAPAGGPPMHLCPATNEHAVSKYMVKRIPGSKPIPACEKCIGPAYTYASMEVIKR